MLLDFNILFKGKTKDWIEKYMINHYPALKCEYYPEGSCWTLDSVSNRVRVVLNKDDICVGSQSG